MKRIHILKAGRYRDVHGTDVAFAQADLTAAAAAYDPDVSEAPLVVGHPDTDAPAYGWVAALAADADGLFASPRQVAPAFAEAVGAGRYKKISASLYPPEHAANPKPGAWYLKHVGFLGGAAPAVKGLRPIEMADDAGCVTVELAAGDDPTETLWQRVCTRIVAAFAEQSNSSPAVPHGGSPCAATPPAALSSTDAGAAAPAVPTPEKPMPDSKPDDAVALAEREDKLARREAALAEAEQRIAADAAKRRRDEIVAFVDGLVDEARLLGRDKAFCVELLAALDPAKTVAFAEAGETREVALAEGLQDLLKQLPKRVETDEIAGGDGLPKAVAFAAPSGRPVDRAGLETHSRALAYQKQH